MYTASVKWAFSVVGLCKLCGVDRACTSFIPRLPRYGTKTSRWRKPSIWRLTLNHITSFSKYFIGWIAECITGHIQEDTYTHTRTDTRDTSRGFLFDVLLYYHSTILLVNSCELHHFLSISLDEQWSITSHVLPLCKNCKIIVYTKLAWCSE